MNAVDDDDNGTIDFQQYLKLTEMLDWYSKEEFLFTITDKDGDEKISKEELRTFARKLLTPDFIRLFGLQVSERFYKDLQG